MVAHLEMILAVFPQPEQGLEALTALRKLEKESSLELYNAALLYPEETRPAGARFADLSEAGRSAFLSGILNNFVARLGGQAGATLGKAAGVVSRGVVGNGAEMGFDAETLKGLKDALPEGSSALLAVVEDEWLDGMLEYLCKQDCTVYRQNTRQSLASQVRETQNKSPEDPPVAGES